MKIKEACTDKYTFSSQLAKIISFNTWTTVTHKNSYCKAGNDSHSIVAR
jgi:hypothetical protein